ncbi:MAG: MBL fold metallo-hydrolase [Methanotrichaceae archaeon]|nr:MBL fold metallo-hydrolase [Methanotrichaceae archaeon]
MPRVSVLKPGSLIRDELGNLLDARSSVTLVTSGSRKIIVDTGLEGEEELIIEALARRGLRPEDIDTVINTHSHPDHCGNNRLFSQAVLRSPSKGETIASGVFAIATPGHTLDSISVVVEASERVEMEEMIETAKVIVIAGDALPTLNNFLKWVPPALHVDRSLAVSSMSRIIEIADIVVPGHDKPFSVAEGKYIQLDY